MGSLVIGGPFHKVRAVVVDEVGDLGFVEAHDVCQRDGSDGAVVAVQPAAMPGVEDVRRVVASHSTRAVVVHH